MFSTTFDYAYTPLDLVLNHYENSYYIIKDMDPKLRQYGEAIIKAFGMKERFFHIEFFRDGDDYIAIEYNNRPAGAFTIDLYNFAHSIDLYRGYADIVNGDPFPQPQVEAQYGLVIHVQHQIMCIQKKNCAKYGDKLKAVKIMPKAFAELQGDVHYILTTSSRSEIDQMIEDFGKK